MQIESFAKAPEVSASARALSRSLGSTLSSLIDTLAITVDRLVRIKPIDADRVATALQTGEALLIVGPPEIGISAVDLDALLPPTEVLQNAGISPAGVIGPRSQELIATAIGQLVIQSHPIVIFVHSAGPGELLGGSELLGQAVSRFRQRGIDTLEWAPLQETDQPSLGSLDPLGQRPVVYIVLAADSAAGGGDTGITGARRATALAQVAQQLVDTGESVLVSMRPSIFGSFGDDDPLLTVLEPFGIIPDPALALLNLKLQGSNRIADPATVLVPPVVQSSDTNSDLHQIGQAVGGLTSVLPWSVPMTLDPRVGVETLPILTMKGNETLWAEREWSQLWSTPAQSRQYLADQPTFDDAKDLRRDDWILGAGAERTQGSDRQRLIVIGSNSWIYDALTFRQGQLVDGRITTAFPGNLALLESSIAWLAGLDDLIAPGVQSRPIATIEPMEPSRLSAFRWILLAGIPGCILLGGIGTRVVLG